MALCIAALSGQLEMVRFYIEEFECDSNIIGFNPLFHYACVNGHLDILKYLAKAHNCDAMARDIDNNTPLHIAALYGQLKTVQYYLEELKCDPNITGFHGRIPLHLACENGHLNVIKYLANARNCDVMARDINNDTPLHIAALNGQLETVLYFLEELKCDPNTTGCSERIPLHHAYQNGHLNVIKYLTEVHNCDAMARDIYNNTPLHVAAYTGQLETFQYFLEELKCDPNITGFHGRIPLHYACEKGHLNILKYLTEVQNCDAMTRDSNNSTPLHIAALNGQLQIVQYFLEELKCDPDITGFNQLIPLHYACVNGHLNVIKFLTDVHNCDAMSRDIDNNTPLHIAALNGQLETFQYFLEEMKCHPNIIGFDGRISLHYACLNGHLNVIKYLTEVHNCDAMARDIYNDTPLHIAAAEGQLETVQYYLEELKCDPNITGCSGRTPLHHACQDGRLNVIKYLTEIHNCDVMARGIDNNTPLHIAALNGQLETFQYFLEEMKCHPNIAGFHGRIPLHDACQNGHLNILKYLTEVHNCNAMTRDIYNNTPLHIAALNGQLQIVRYFLEELKCDPDITGFNQLIPLHYACVNGHLNVIKFLTEVYNCDAMSRDIDNNTPLHIAASSGQLNIVHHFLEELKCDPNTTGFHGRIPLHDACVNGHYNVIKYLANASNCDVMARDINNDTPLNIAALNGQLETVRYFLEELKCDPNITGFHGRIPLHDACVNGHLNIIKYLTEVHNCDVMARDIDNNTPLHIAAHNGQLETVRYFLEELKCDPNITGFHGRIPLHDACEKGHLNVIKYLVVVHNCDALTRDTFSNETAIYFSFIECHLHILIKFLVTHNLFDVCQRSDNRSLSVNEMRKTFFTTNNSIMSTASAFNSLEIIKHICTFCRIDPKLLRNFKHIKTVTTDSKLLDFFESYIDPLHKAAITGDLKSIISYVSEKKWSPLLFDRHGNNLLHNAAQYGQLQVAKYLLTVLHCDPFIKNKKGLLAIQLASNNGFLAVKSFILRLTSTKPILEKYALSRICCIMVMGNSGAGKSTLVRSITSKKSLIHRVLPVHGVTPFTAGVVPCTMKNEEFENIKIYDFAGHEDYYASHEAIIQHTTYPFIIIVFNATLPLSDIQKQLSFWTTIILNSKNVNQLNLIVVASHIDQCRNKQVLNDSNVHMNDFLSRSSKNIAYHGLIECDCRYPVSKQMKRVLSKIATIRKTVTTNHAQEESDYSNRLCASLMHHFRLHKNHLPATITLRELEQKIEAVQLPGPSLVRLTEKKLLIDICEALSSLGHILYFPHETNSDKSLLVINEEVILGHVHASIQHIKEGILNDIGMLEESELKIILIRKVPVDPDMAIKYLIFAQFCTLVSIDLIRASSYKKENFYFFPNMVQNETPVNLFVEEDEYTSIYTWMQQCNDQKFFTPRCIHNLFIHILQGEKSDKCAQYDIWKNGILIVNSSTIRSVIEFTDQTTCIKLQMQCHKSYLHELAKERSKLIGVIRSVVAKVCPNFKTTEFLLLPQNYPIKDSIAIPVQKIAQSIIENKAGVLVSSGQGRSKNISCPLIQDILGFDSIQALENPECQLIFGRRNSDSKISADMFDCMKRKFPIMNITIEMTYDELYQEIIMYSIFNCESLQVSLSLL